MMEHYNIVLFGWEEARSSVRVQHREAGGYINVLLDTLLLRSDSISSERLPCCDEFMFFLFGTKSR